MRIRLLLALMFLSLGGCGAPRDDEPSAREQASSTRHSKRAGERLVTMAELDQLNKAFADRYLTYVVTACEHLARANPDPEQRRLANLLRLVSVAAVYDIVTNADPYTSTLDLVLVVTLQSQVWIDEDRAGTLFGTRGDVLARNLRDARTDVWDLAAKVLKPDQLQVLDWMIWDWRRKHPDIELVSFVRFSDFASGRGKSVLAEVPKGGGLLAPVGDAAKAVDEVRLLAERGFYYGKRLPFLLGWQTEAMADELASKPELAQAIAGFTQLSESVARLTAVAESLPTQLDAQRAHVRSEVEKLEQTLASVLAGYGKAVGQTQEMLTATSQTLGGAQQLAESLEPVLGSTERIMELMQGPPGAPSAPAGPPLDPNEALKSMNQALVELNAVTVNLNQGLASAERLLVSPEFVTRLKEVDGVAAARMDQATVGGSGLVDRIFWRALALIAAVLLAAITYRVLARRLARRGDTP